MSILHSRSIAFVLLALLLVVGTRVPPASQASLFAVQEPVLKWQHGGCYASWCQTGWYSSSAVADLDEDGSMEVIGAAYSIFVVDGSSGTLEWSVASGHDRTEPGGGDVGRTWPGVVVADLDADGALEIATAHGEGYVSVYNADGYFEAGWPQQPTQSELRGLSAYDMDGNGDLEIIVTGAVGSEVNTWIYDHDGTLRSGWPQLSDDRGFAYGVFNANAAVGDLDGDGDGEVVVPSDVHYICAYQADGRHIPASPQYEEKYWGQVGVWENLQTELRGWGECDGTRVESYRANFAHGPADIADLDGNGVAEVIVVGNVYNCKTPYTSQYFGPFIFSANRNRFLRGEYDWRSTPVDTGAPLTEDYNLIENAQPNPVVADLDGEGVMEILYASYDGRLHAFWLDKTEHGNWPYSVYDAAEGYTRFASEPTVADLDDNGLAEVIFTSWVQKGSGLTGKLHILDDQGNVLYEIDLPIAFGGDDWNGALPAPTLADIDGDDELEAVINTAHSGLVAYDLPGTANAQLLWGTGRGSYLRNGYLPTRVIWIESFVPFVVK
jgi:hypothetical protein